MATTHGRKVCRMPIRRIENPGEAEQSAVADLAAKTGCNVGSWGVVCWYGCWSDLSDEALINQGRAISSVVRQILESQGEAESESHR